LKSVGGVTESPLKIIAQELEWVEKKEQLAPYERMILSHFRVRKPGGGNKGILTTPLQQVLFVFYFCNFIF
jgi:hypothetical protein